MAHDYKGTGFESGSESKLNSEPDTGKTRLNNWMPDIVNREARTRSSNRGEQNKRILSGLWSQLRQRPALSACLIYVLLLVVFFWPVFLEGKILLSADMLFTCPPWKAHAPPGWERPYNLATGDQVTCFYQWRLAAREMVRSGDLPLWNQYIFCGYPLLANYQTAVFHPLTWLFYVVPMDLATNGFVLIQLWLAGVFAYCFARHLRLGQIPAVLVGVAYMFTGTNVVWAGWAHSTATMWTPVVLICIDKLFTEKSGRWVPVLAVVFGLLLLSGHPESIFVVALACGLYWLGKIAVAVLDRAGVKRAVLTVLPLLAAGCLGLLISMVQILPFLEFVRNSYTMVERSGAAPGGLPYPMEGVISFLVPRFFGDYIDLNYWGTKLPIYDQMLYVGIVPLLLASGTLVARRHVAREALRASWVSLYVALILTLLAFDVTSPGWIWKIPFFQQTRPAYFTMFTGMAVSIAAGTTLEAWLRGDSSSRRRIMLALAVTAMLFVLVTAAVTRSNAALIRLRGLVSFEACQMLTRASLLAAALAAFAVHWRVGRRRTAFAMLITALVFVDLALFGMRQDPKVPRSSVYPETATFRAIQQDTGLYRAGSPTRDIPPCLAVYHIPICWGEEGIIPLRNRLALGSIPGGVSGKWTDALNLKYLLVSDRGSHELDLDDTSRYRLVSHAEGVRVYENLLAKPRAFVVHEATWCTGQSEVLDALADPEFDPTTHVLLEGTPPEESPGMAALTSPPAESHALIDSYHPLRVSVTANMNAPGYLILSDSYYPGWHARVNDAPASIYPANLFLRAVHLPAGVHRVIFEYRPASVRVGALMSFIGLAATACMAAFLPIRSRGKSR